MYTTVRLLAYGPQSKVDARAAFAAGVADVLVLPMAPALLAVRLKHYLPSPSAHEQGMAAVAPAAVDDMEAAVSPVDASTPVAAPVLSAPTAGHWLPELQVCLLSTTTAVSACFLVGLQILTFGNGGIFALAQFVFFSTWSIFRGAKKVSLGTQAGTLCRQQSRAGNGCSSTRCLFSCCSSSAAADDMTSATTYSAFMPSSGQSATSTMSVPCSACTLRSVPLLLPSARVTLGM